MPNPNRTFDLQKRLTNYAVAVIRLAEKLPKSLAGNHLAKQIIRSASSPALNYGEAIAAESQKDFVHKLRIALKELRETFNALKIISQLYPNHLPNEVEQAISQTDELAAILYKSIQTSQRNKSKS